jgi:hypothetical protein
MSDNAKEAAGNGSGASICYAEVWDLLGRKLARGIMECGDEPDMPCTRIQFKSGQWTEDGKLELNNGGLCESALANLISELLLNGNSG